MSTATVDTWVGRDAILYPGDTVNRHVHVVNVDEHGWELEVLAKPGYNGTAPGYRPGDRLYYSHSMRLVLCELTEADR